MTPEMTLETTLETTLDETPDTTARTTPPPGAAPSVVSSAVSSASTVAGPVAGAGPGAVPGVVPGARAGRERRVVRVAALTVGDGPVPVVGGLAGDVRPDGRWIRLPARPGRAPAAMAIARLRREWRGPLLAAPATHNDLAEVAVLADGLVIGVADRCQDCAAPLLPEAARLGRPVVLRRGGAGLTEWLAALDRCLATGNDRIVLCEGADRPDPAGHPGTASGGPDGAGRGGTGPDGRGPDGAAAEPGCALDLGLLRAARERSGRPVLAYLGHDAGLAPAAIAAGADGLMLAPAASPGAVALAHEAATVISGLVREERPASVPEARAAIDRVDAALAVLLERRAALAGIVQRLKPVGGFAGRDMERERRLVAAMARRAPRLGEARLAPIMNAVIEAGLHLSEEERGRTP